METNEKKNVLVIVLGVSLILLIAFFTFFRSRSGKEKAPNSAYSDYAESVKKSKKITSEDLRQKILRKENLLVIDTRSANAYVREHILDSVNIPFTDLLNAVPTLDKERTYVLIDDGSNLQAAYLAGSLFEKNEFRNVFYLSGGFVAWKDKVNLTVSEGDPNVFSDQAKVTYVSSDELKKLFESNASLFLIDLRDSEEKFKAGHLKNANYLSLENLEKERKTIPFGKRIVLYDEYSLRAFQGAVRLYDMGFLKVLALSDGFKAWTDKGYEVVK